MRPSTLKKEEASFPGAFTTDGAWNEKAFLVQRGETDRLVRALCRERKFARLSPQDAHLAIEASSKTRAFPNREQWKSCEHWAMAQTSTSAEEAVKRAGETTDVEHHWCAAGKWLPGKQSDCPETMHREHPDKERLREIVQEITQKTLASGPSLPQEAVSRPPVTLGPAPDEVWPGWEKVGDTQPRKAIS